MYDLYDGNLGDLTGIQINFDGQEWRFILFANGKKYYERDYFTRLMHKVKSEELAKWYRERISDMIIAMKQGRDKLKKDWENQEG